MIKKPYLIILGAVIIIGIAAVSIIIINLEPPYKIKINTINPAEMGMEEWIEDLEYLYTYVEENYPFLEIKNRTHGFNWLDLKEMFTEQINNAEDNEDFFNVIMNAVLALQNRHTYLMHPTTVEQYKNDYQNWKPMNEIFSEEIANAGTYWTSIYNQYNDKYNQKYNVMIVYEKGEYVIYDYNTTWELTYGNETIVTHVDGVEIDTAIETVFDKGYIDYDFQRNKNYIWSIYPYHFGEDAVFSIRNATGYETNVQFEVISGDAQNPYKYPESLVNLTIWSEDRIGYVYVGVFVEDKLEPYAEDVETFFGQLKDVDNLIIDIRGNTGGYYSVWIENLVQPLINESIRHEQYFAYKSGKHVNYLHKQWVTTMNKVSKNQFDYLPPEVLTDEYTIYNNYMTYSPTGEVGFTGNITLLIDNMVYSAAEGFANFCNEYGFAKIYGTSSGGDGIILFPQYFVLPNSKLVIGAASAIGFDSTGYANEEVRTQADVYYESSYGNFDELRNYVLSELWS